MRESSGSFVATRRSYIGTYASCNIQLEYKVFSSTYGIFLWNLLASCGSCRICRQEDYHQSKGGETHEQE
jgi:hypothetical protein